MEEKTKVVLGLIQKGGQFVIIKRRKPLLHLEWAFPGGIIKPGETEEQAVIREVQEEVGMDVEVIGEKLLERKHPNTLVQVCYYPCAPLNSKEPIIGEEYEIVEVKWAKPEEVLEFFTSDVHPVIREYILSFAKKPEGEALLSRRSRETRR